MNCTNLIDWESPIYWWQILNIREQPYSLPGYESWWFEESRSLCCRTKSLRTNRTCLSHGICWTTEHLPLWMQSIQSRVSSFTEESIRWFDIDEQPSLGTLGSFCSAHLSSDKEYLLSQTQEKHSIPALKDPSRALFTSQRGGEKRDVWECIQSDAVKLNLD